MKENARWQHLRGIRGKRHRFLVLGVVNTECLLVSIAPPGESPELLPACIPVDLSSIVACLLESRRWILGVDGNHSCTRLLQNRCGFGGNNCRDDCECGSRRLLLDRGGFLFFRRGLFIGSIRVRIIVIFCFLFEDLLRLTHISV